MVRAKKVKKKIWFKVVAPEYFNKAELGEALAAEAEELIGRTVETTLGELTGDLSKQHVKLLFRIEGVADGVANTELKEYSLSLPFLARLARRNVTIMDEVMDVTTKDLKKLRVKFLVITLTKAHRRQCTQIRKKLREIVSQEVSKVEAKSFFLAVCNHSFQDNLFQLIKKIFPLRHLEIRKIEVKG